MESTSVTRGVISRKGEEKVPAPQGSGGRTYQTKHEEAWREVSRGAANPAGSLARVRGAAGAAGTRPGQGGACLGTLLCCPGVPRSRSKWRVLISPAEKVVVVVCLTRIWQGGLGRASVFTCVLCARSVCVVVPSPTEHPVRDLAPPPSSGSLIFQSGRPLAAPPRPPGPELEACAVEDAAEGPRGLGRLHTPGSLRSWRGTGGGSVGGRAPVRFPARDGGTG